MLDYLHLVTVLYTWFDGIFKYDITYYLICIWILIYLQGLIEHLYLTFNVRLSESGNIPLYTVWWIIQIWKYLLYYFKTSYHISTRFMDHLYLEFKKLYYLHLVKVLSTCFGGSFTDNIFFRLFAEELSYLFKVSQSIFIEQIISSYLQLVKKVFT